MPVIATVHGDITRQQVDAIVNAANNAMRGGGGVDGAIHYRRALQVADELGARTVAFPLISSGIYGWPRDDAIAAAIETIAAADTRVEQTVLVAFDTDTYEAVRAQLDSHR